MPITRSQAKSLRYFAMNTARVRSDFDEIARLSDCHAVGGDQYDTFLLSQVPTDAMSVLDVGCGLGRLAVKLAGPRRKVIGVDLSPEMIARARKEVQGAAQLTFLCGDFLERDFTAEQFDCVISASALHHMSEEVAVPRMVKLLRPGGRLILHDIRSDAGLGERLLTNLALAQLIGLRLLRTGRLRTHKAVRKAWANHCADEKYLTQREAGALAARLLPGARLFYHWLWSYTIVWDKPGAVNPAITARSD